MRPFTAASLINLFCRTPGSSDQKQKASQSSTCFCSPRPRLTAQPTTTTTNKSHADPDSAWSFRSTTFPWSSHNSRNKGCHDLQSTVPTNRQSQAQTSAARPAPWAQKVRVPDGRRNTLHHCGLTSPPPPTSKATHTPCTYPGLLPHASELTSRAERPSIGSLPFRLCVNIYGPSPGYDGALYLFLCSAAL